MNGNEIMVYFNSGHKARLPVEKTLVVMHGDAPRFADVVAGNVLVNWDNVSFIRAVPDREEEDDL